MGEGQRRRCVVTGAGGLIGSHLLPELVAAGWEVHATSHRRPDGADERGVMWHSIDLAAGWDESRLPTAVDAVVYLAQSEHFREFPDRAAEILEVNTMGVLRLLDYARRAGASRFVLGSSGGVYGSGGDGFSEDREIPARGDLGFYLGSKLCAEIVAENYAPYLQVEILRFFFVYGPGQRRSMLVPRLVESVAAGQPVTLHGRDGLRLNPTHVSDAVAAVQASLEVSGSHKVNVAGPEVLSLREVAATIGEVLGVEPRFEEVPGQEPAHLVGDVRLMSRLLVAPRVRFGDGVRDMIRSMGLLPAQAAAQRGGAAG
jgi:UDP-glucose 4-epimerase